MYNGKIWKIIMQDKIKTTWKVIFVGDSGVGKTSIIMRSIGKFKKNPESTIGVDFVTRHIDEPFPCDIQFWDTAGQERFRALNPMYIRESDIQIVVYDVSDTQSFQNISYWIEEIKKYRLEPRMILVGNKMDQKRIIDQEKGANVAKMYGMDFIEISAMKNLYVDELTNHIINLVVYKLESIKNNHYVPYMDLNKIVFQNVRFVGRKTKSLYTICC